MGPACRVTGIPEYRAMPVSGCVAWVEHHVEDIPEKQVLRVQVAPLAPGSQMERFRLTGSGQMHGAERRQLFDQRRWREPPAPHALDMGVDPTSLNFMTRF